jgi:hypothetical protein
MPGFPINFTQEEDDRLTRISSKVGMKKRPWVMKVIMEAMDAAENKVEIIPVWVFELNDGRVLEAPGRRVGDAWETLGFQVHQAGLIKNRWLKEEAPVMVPVDPGLAAALNPDELALASRLPVDVKDRFEAVSGGKKPELKATTVDDMSDDMSDDLPFGK